MILHICEDNRFVSLAKQQFEAIDEYKNIFLVNSSNNNLQYINKSENVFIASPNSKLHKQIISKYNYQLIVFHNCNQKYKWNIIINSKSTAKILWLAWGSDIYSLPKLSKVLLLPYTKRIARKNYIGSINTYLNKITRIVLRKNQKLLNAYKKVDFCAPVMSMDLQILNKTYDLNIKESSFTYGFLSYYIGEDKERTFNGNNILVGNSGHPNSNHIDTFQLIKNINEGDIITPLSYGGTSSYIKKVTKYGTSLFENRFKPLVDLIPIQEYRNILYSCKAAFMYHQRQQALGNIIMLLWMGVKVYLDEINPIYDFFRKQGVYIYSINEFTNNKTKNIIELTTKEIENNRMHLERLYSYKNIIQETKDLIHHIYNPPTPQ